MHTSFGEYLFRNRKFSLFWLLVRLYVGLAWFEAGISKVMNPAWVGEGAGAAVTGFVKGALLKTGGAHPDVAQWYAFFLEKAVLPNTTFFSYLVSMGELLVGVGLIVGALTGVAAAFGAVMNMAYLLAGTVSTNPVLLILTIGLMLAWRIAGYYGIDRVLFKRFKSGS